MSVVFHLGCQHLQYKNTLFFFAMIPILETILLCIDTNLRDMKMYYHGSRLGYETNGLSHSSLQRALLVVILLTSIRGIKNFTKRNALGGVNCNYLHECIFGLPLNLRAFWINLIFIPPIFDCKPINWYKYKNCKTYRFTPYRYLR